MPVRLKVPCTWVCEVAVAWITCLTKSACCVVQEWACLRRRPEQT